MAHIVIKKLSQQQDCFSVFFWIFDIWLKDIVQECDYCVLIVSISEGEKLLIVSISP